MNQWVNESSSICSRSGGVPMHRDLSISVSKAAIISFLLNYFPAGLFLRSDRMYSLRQSERPGIVMQSLKGIAAAVGRNDYRITLISYDDVATVARVSHH